MSDAIDNITYSRLVLSLLDVINTAATFLHFLYAAPGLATSFLRVKIAESCIGVQVDVQSICLERLRCVLGLNAHRRLASEP